MSLSSPSSSWRKERQREVQLLVCAGMRRKRRRQRRWALPRGRVGRLHDDAWGRPDRVRRPMFGRSPRTRWNPRLSNGGWLNRVEVSMIRTRGEVRLGTALGVSSSLLQSWFPDGRRRVATCSQSERGTARTKEILVCGLVERVGVGVGGGLGCESEEEGGPGGGRRRREGDTRLSRLFPKVGGVEKGLGEWVERIG